MIGRINFENNNEIGLFLKLTSTYCLVANGDAENLYGILETELNDIPVIRTSISGSREVGKLTCGNGIGLLVPDSITDEEFQNLRDNLPDNVKIGRVKEDADPLGHLIACNDSFALVHPDLGTETEEIIKDTLGVEVVRHSVAGQMFVGNYCVFSNQGGIVHPSTSQEELDELSNLLNVPIVAASINGGSDTVGAGLVTNDAVLYTGVDATSKEISVLESVFSMDLTHGSMPN